MKKKELNMPHWYCACVDAAGCIYIGRIQWEKNVFIFFVYYVRIVDITWRGDGVYSVYSVFTQHCMALC